MKDERMKMTSKNTRAAKKHPHDVTQREGTKERLKSPHCLTSVRVRFTIMANNIFLKKPLVLVWANASLSD